MASPRHASALSTPSSDWTSYAPVDAPLGQRLAAAASDVAEGCRRHRAWRYLATEFIKNQYRRTVLGPWWITMQTAIYVLGLAVVFGQLQNAPLKAFLPYVALGYLTFVMLSGLTRAGSTVFTANAGLIKSTRQPLSSLVLRGVMVELILFGHNAVIIVAFFAMRLIDPSPWLVLAPAAVLLILVNGVALGLWLGTVVARFRDVGPAVDSVLQVAVFFTPVFYRPEDLGGAEVVVRFNPFTYFIELLRDSVLGDRPTLVTAVGVAGFTLLNLAVALVVFARGRSRLPYWVA